MSYFVDVDKVKKQFKWKTLDNYDEWKEMVTNGHNRVGNHDFDVVEGPFLDNHRSVTDSDCDEFPLAVGHQIAFCTDAVLHELKFATKRVAELQQVFGIV